MNRRVPAPRVEPRGARLRLVRLVPILALSACASVLGIEDIEEDPELANSGSTSTTTDAQGGDKNTGGSKGGGAPTMTTGGAPSDGGGNGGGNGGSSLGGSAAMAGDGNVGGMVNPEDPTVRGTLIDFWGTPVPNMPIQIGDQLTTTDDDGQFVIPDVPASYDVELSFDLPTSGNSRAKAYLFQGLKRRDPTIQIRQGFELRYGTAVVTPTNMTLATGDAIKLAVGGKTGNVSATLPAGGREQSCYWQGTETTQQTAHALHLSLDDDTELPTGYKSFGSALVGLAETGKTQVSLDLTPKSVTSGNLQGSATSGGGTDRENWVYLRFDTGAVMELINDTDGPNAFSYLVPTVPSSTITVAASEGWEMVDGPYAIAYQTGLSADDQPALQIPTPATLTAPADGKTGVDGTTPFRFTSPSSNSGPFVVHFENVDLNGPYQDLYVITAEKEITIPDVLDGGFQLNPGNVVRWNVETHGKFASVDAMMGSSGFWDLFTWEEGPVGTLSDDGEWTNSAPRYFTTAP